MAGGKEVRAGKAFVEVSLRDRVEAGLKRIAVRLRAFSSLVNSIGTRMLGVSAAFAAPFIPAIKAASDMEETMSKFNTVFGDNAAAIKKWADDFAGNVGRSKQQIASFMAGSQDLFVPLGFDTSTAENLSKTITGLSIDLASFNNMSDTDVLRDLHAALTGSGEVMKKYGVIVSETAVKQELLNQGLDPNRATQQQKVMARLGIILRGTTAAQGDALRTAGSFANQMKRLKGTLSDVAVELGNAVLPTVTSLVSVAASTLRVVGDWITQNKRLVMTIAAVAVVIGVAGAALIGLGGLLHVAAMAVTGMAALWGIAGVAVMFLPRMALRAVRGVAGATNRLLSQSRRTVAGWTASWNRASQTFATWRKRVAAEASKVQASLRPITNIGRRIGSALSAGIRRSAGAVTSAWNHVTAGVQRLPRQARAAFTTIRGYAAAFGRGFSGDMTLFTTRANAAFWALGETTRSVFNRIGQYARAAAPLVQGAFSAAANRIAPIWERASRRILASFLPLRETISSVWQRISMRATSAASQMRTTLASAWQSISARATSTAANTWSRVTSIVQRQTKRARSAVSSSYASMANVASQQWQRVASAAQQVATRAAATWQRLPVWVREPLARIAMMASQDAQRVASRFTAAFRKIPSAATAAWQRIRVAGVQAATHIATVTRSAMRRAFTLTQAAGIRTFTRVRAVGVASMRSIGRAGMAIPGRLGGAFSAAGAAVSMLAPAGGGMFGTLLMSIPLVMSAVGALGAAFAGLLSPIGLIAVAVIAGIAAWTAWTTEGQQTLGALTQVFGSLWSVARKVFGGLSDALAAGDMKLAARILWAGLKALWFTGIAELNKVWPTLQSAAQAVWQQIAAAGSAVVSHLAEVWSQLPNWLTGPLGAIGEAVSAVFGWIGEQAGSLVAGVSESFAAIGTALAEGDFALAAEIAWASIQMAFAQGMAWVTNAWTEFATGLASIFDGVITSIRQIWNNISTWIARQLLNLVGLIQSAVAKLAEIDPTGLSDKLKAAIAFDVEGAIRILEEDSQRFNQGLDQAKSSRDDERVSAMRQQIAETEQRLAELRAAREDALKRADALAEDESESPLAGAMAELEDALAQAAAKGKLFDADGAQSQFDTSFDAGKLPSVGGNASLAGTFNAAIAGLLGRSGNDPAERTAEAVESMDETLADINDELKTRPPLAFDA